MLSYRPFAFTPWFTGLLFVATLASQAAAIPINGLSQVGGWVYIDRNNDGVLAFSDDPLPEFVVGDVVISLFSVVGNVETLISTMETDDFGRYLFENINPGEYVLRQTQPIEFVDGLDTLGILQSYNARPIPGNASAGALFDNAFLGIVLTPNVGGEFYNFGERGLAPGYASKRFLLATRPPLNSTPPPPTGEPVLPEPTAIAVALIAGLANWITPRRWRRRSSPQVVEAEIETVGH